MPHTEPQPHPTTEAPTDRRTDEPPDRGPEAPELPDQVPALPLDVVFDVLSNERRRRVLHFLVEDPETTLGDLAEHIAALENDKPERELSSTERKRVYICLYQCHLPRMDDAGVIDFDEHRKTVVKGDAFEQLQPYLRARPSDDDSGPSAGRYLGVTTVGAGALGLQSVLFPAVWLSSLILGVLVAVVGLFSVEHLHRIDRLSL